MNIYYKVMSRQKIKYGAEGRGRHLLGAEKRDQRLHITFIFIKKREFTLMNVWEIKPGKAIWFGREKECLVTLEMDKPVTLKELLRVVFCFLAVKANRIWKCKKFYL